MMLNVCLIKQKGGHSECPPLTFDKDSKKEGFFKILQDEIY